MRSKIISRMHCADDRFDCDLLRAIADANRGWGTRDGREARRDDRALAGADAAERAAALPELGMVVFTGTGDLRKVSGRPAQGRPGL